PTVAVGVDVEIDVARPHLIEDHRDADRAGAAVAELAVSLLLAAVGDLLNDVLRPFAPQRDRPQGRGLAPGARPRQDVTPAVGPCRGGQPENGESEREDRGRLSPSRHPPPRPSPAKGEGGNVLLAGGGFWSPPPLRGRVRVGGRGLEGRPPRVSLNVVSHEN